MLDSVFYYNLNEGNFIGTDKSSGKMTLSIAFGINIASTASSN